MTPDGARAFVADGAAISVLDMTTLSSDTPPAPLVLERIELENCSPEKILYYEHPVSGSKVVFVAGGTMGLWRLGDLCPEMFSTPPPSGTPPHSICPCSEPETPCDPYFRARLDDPAGTYDPLTFSSKRCVDLAILEGNATAGGDPLLFALFSARADTPLQPNGYGPSELQVYRLHGNDTVTLHRPPLLLQHASLPANAVATAIATKPVSTGNPRFAYVAMGTGGLFRVTLTPTQFTAEPLGNAPGCSVTPCLHGEVMRDLAIVKTKNLGVRVYATMDYGRLIEYAVDVTPPTETVYDLQTAGFPDRIAATTDGDDNVLLAIGFGPGPGLGADTFYQAPNGGWSTRCINGPVFDPNFPPGQAPNPCPGGCIGNVRFYKRQIGTPPPGDLVQLFPTMTFMTADVWRDLALLRLPGGGYRSYEVTLRGGLDTRIVRDPFGAATQSVESGYGSLLFNAIDGVVTSSNRDLIWFHQDATEDNPRVPTLFLRPPPYELDFVPVEDAVLCNDLDPTIACNAEELPNPYTSAGFFGAAHWQDGAEEWFLAASKTLVRLVPQPQTPCPFIPEDEQDCWTNDICSPGTQLAWTFESLPSAPTNVGASLVRMAPDALMHGPLSVPPSAQMLGAQWFQAFAPTMGGDIDRSENNDLGYAFADPRTETVNGTEQPKYVYIDRGGSEAGIKVFRRADLMVAAALASTPCGLPPDPGSPLRGIGQSIGVVPFAEIKTHVEFEDNAANDPCDIQITCPGIPLSQNPRHLLNGQAEVFQLGSHYVLAATGGFVGTIDPAPTCNWSPHFGRPQVVFYDVSDLALEAAFSDSSTPTHVPLLRVGFEAPWDAAPSEGWPIGLKVRVSATVPPVAHVYVADFLGRLYVYEVTEEGLFSPPVTGPYMGSNGVPNYPVLAPLDTLVMPVDPRDDYGIPGQTGFVTQPINVIDLELDPEGPYLYCTLGRRGFGVVDIEDPASLVLLEIVDTPGIPIGMALRQDAADNWQLVMGDSNAGIRLYGRNGQ